MIVCICKGLSDRAIHGVIREGAETVDQIGDACGAGTDCGTCKGSLEELIHEVDLTARSAASRRQLREARELRVCAGAKASASSSMLAAINPDGGNG